MKVRHGIVDPESLCKLVFQALGTLTVMRANCASFYAKFRVLTTIGIHILPHSMLFGHSLRNTDKNALRHF